MPAITRSPVHGEGRGLPHVLVEIRQDGIATPADAAAWALRLAATCAQVEPADCVARQPRIRVERHDVANICGHGRRTSVETQKRGVCSTTQEPVQFVQLAALALPPEPPPFAFVPHPLAMQ